MDLQPRRRPRRPRRLASPQPPLHHPSPSISCLTFPPPELYRATSDSSYITSARTIADAVLSSSSPLTTAPDGILTESSCTPDDASGCNNDQQIFKGIFAYNLAELDGAVPDGSRPYRAFLRQNAQAAHDRARGAGTDLYDVSWTGPFWNSTIAKQASAVGLLVANI